MPITEEIKVSIIHDILIAAYSTRATRQKAQEVLAMVRALDNTRDSKGRFTKK